MERQRGLVLTLATPPEPQPRPRCRCTQSRKRGLCPACRQPVARPVPQMYSGDNPGRTGRSFSDWQQEVVQEITRAWRRPPLNGPIRFVATFVVARPQSRPTVARQTTRTVNGRKRKIDNPQHLGGHFIVDPEAWKAGGRVLCPRKPDLDRYVNAIWDALTTAGVWWDDAQACDERSTKWYAARGEDPSLRIRVEPA